MKTNNEKNGFLFLGFLDSLFFIFTHMSSTELLPDFEKKITLRRGEYLFCAGDTVTDLYYIQCGCVQLYILDKNEVRIIRFGYKGSYICALDSLITQLPTVYYLQAIRHTKILIPPKEKRALLFHDHEGIKELLLQFQEREIDLLTETPFDRYKRVLKRSPLLFQEVPQKYIATYLRMTPETLSRLKKLDLDQVLED